MIHLEQYMDFLRHRMFRQTLLVHKNVTPNYQIKWEQLKTLHVGSPAKAKGEVRLDSTEPDLFETPEGITLQSREPIVKAAMVVLGEIWPKNRLFGELVAAARKRLTTNQTNHTNKEEEEKGLGQAILSFYASASTSLVELWWEPPKFTMAASDKPVAMALAREQAKTKGRVTNVRHESVFLGDFERQLIQRLDGTRDRAALVKDLAELVRRGELTVEKDGQPVREDEALAKIIGDAIEQQLAMLGRSALLV